jgi:selenide,water dikinase
VKFGYAVTGLIHPARFRANAHAQAGDVLVLTKALGTGVIATALKRGVAEAGAVEAATASMLALNRGAAEAMAGLGVHGCTDITGFGLLGHAREMAVASGVTLALDAAAMPALPGALAAIAAGAIPGGLNNNRNFVEGCVRVEAGVDAAQLTLLYDPQTSGGLLISLAAAEAHELVAAVPGGVVVGEVLERKEEPLWVR